MGKILKIPKRERYRKAIAQAFARSEPDVAVPQFHKKELDRDPETITRWLRLADQALDLQKKA